jgi:hypothetical protein
MLVSVAALLLTLVGCVLSAGANPPTTTQAMSGAATHNDQRRKSAQPDDFLLFGTVFTKQGFALPGAGIRVRRAGERKVRWEARSDRRGEFAVRVPRGAEYEMSVSAAGYREQTRRVDARTGIREDFIFRPQPASGGKPK